MNGRRKDTLTLYLMMISLMFILAGCAEGVYHVEINQDGSADLHITAGLDEKVRNFTGDWNPLDVFQSKLEKNHFKVNDYHEGDYSGVIASKHYQSTELMIDDLHGSRQTMGVKDQGEDDLKKGGPLFDFQVDEALFYTTYKIMAQIDVPHLLQEQFGLSPDRLSGLVKSIGNQFLDQLDLKVKLTLPHRFDIHHNATVVEDDGRTFVWDFDPAAVNEIELELSIPNVRNIVATSIGGFAVVVIILLMVIRYRCYKNK